MDIFDVYGEQMKKMYQDAFAVAEKMKEGAAADRQAAFEQLNAAKDARKKAEETGGKIALDYFARRHKILVDQTRKEVLSALIVKHLKEGKTDDEIGYWFDADKDFIEHCKIIVKKETQMFDTPQIKYSQEGRGGTVTYVAGNTKINFDWEFAGGNGVAIIFVPEEKYWLAHTGVSLSERKSILEFVALKVIAHQAPGCVYEISDNCIEILYKASQK